MKNNGRKIPAQYRISLGYISLSSHHTKQFSLPHHAPKLSRIHPPDGLARYSGRMSRYPTHSPPISRYSASQVTALNVQASNSPLPMNPTLTNHHTDIRRDSAPILCSKPTRTSSTFSAP